MIGWGTVAIVAGVVLLVLPPLGLGLMVLGVVLFVRGWRMRKQPRWLAIAAVRNSRKANDPGLAEQDLQQALRSWY